MRTSWLWIWVDTRKHRYRKGTTFCITFCIILHNICIIAISLCKVSERPPMAPKRCVSWPPFCIIIMQNYAKHLHNHYAKLCKIMPIVMQNYAKLCKIMQNYAKQKYAKYKKLRTEVSA